MTLYNVKNTSNYPKTVGNEEFQPGESKELDLEEEQVEEALRGFKFEEVEESEDDSDEQDLEKTDEGQESKSDEENQEEVN